MPPATVWVHCNRCSRTTRHIVEFAKKIEGEEETDYALIRWWDEYEVLVCAGCDDGSVRHTNYFEPRAETTVVMYPPRVSRRRPDWFWKLPEEVRDLLAEVYHALDADSRALALMGARAVADILLTEQVGDVGGFAAKLKAIEKAGIVSLRNAAVLEAALDAGSAASHRGFIPSAEDMNAVMDILENILQAVYHLESLAKSLKERTPPRDTS